jgi:rifampin ADP-ribosylating transferase
MDGVIIFDPRSDLERRSCDGTELKPIKRFLSDLISVMNDTAVEHGSQTFPGALMTAKIKEFAQSFFHGTKAALQVGDQIVAANDSNYEDGRKSKYVYFTSNLVVAAWGAELAAGNNPCCIYVVEPIGEWDDDPNVTNKRFPGNPTNSFRTASPLVVIGVVSAWQGHSEDEIAARKEGLKKLMQSGARIIED